MPQPNIYHLLHCVHRYLMNKGFPYHSVSVIHRPQDLRFHCIFDEAVRDRVDDAVKRYLKDEGEYEFTYSFVKCST